MLEQSLAEQFRRMSGPEVLDYLRDKSLTLNSGHTEGLNQTKLHELPKLNPNDPKENKRYSFDFVDIFEVSGDGKRVMFKDINIDDAENPFREQLTLMANATMQMRTESTNVGTLAAKVGNYWTKMSSDVLRINFEKLATDMKLLNIVVQDTSIFIAALESIFTEKTSQIVFGEEKRKLDEAFAKSQEVVSSCLEVVTNAEILNQLKSSSE